MFKRIKELREAKGLSQEKLAQRADISRQMIVNLESGAVGNTSTDTLAKIALALGVSTSEIWEVTPDNEGTK